MYDNLTQTLNLCKMNVPQIHCHLKYLYMSLFSFVQIDFILFYVIDMN